MTTKQLVYMKGTKEGLVLMLDDQCGYSELVSALKGKLMEDRFDEQIEVQISTGNRFCDGEQMKELLNVVQESLHVRVSKVKSDVITIEESNQRILESQSSTYVGIVRSGQKIKSEGDLVVIGDVNPNARVEAGGSIFVLGRLKGIAHAGVNGNRDTVIGASWLEATHLMIADVMEIMTNEKKELSETPEMECAYLLADGNIAIKRLQELRVIRPNLSTFKGGS
ncbi:septum site-determining protein MinC [Kurthia sibirica]|uniref:Probable septum site-determining protein MinC n=1 Tax=Kurthia sibirica TaxID=202750 RepID=A0A2U3AIL3_9BACL|nr:septum site-determining protein MinC [Kurthia sibirica]PWI24324.1 septum site-determining protein MinC [Kurthia sibirica]GEK34390.1 septum site-determining protein MinC [Kurthia sibirica]